MSPIPNKLLEVSRTSSESAGQFSSRNSSGISDTINCRKNESVSDSRCCQNRARTQVQTDTCC